MNTGPEQETPSSRKTVGESEQTLVELVRKRWKVFVNKCPVWGCVVAVLGLLLIVVTFLAELHFVTRTFFGDPAGDFVVLIAFVAVIGGALAVLVITGARKAVQHSFPITSTEVEATPLEKKPSTAWGWGFVILFSIMLANPTTRKHLNSIFGPQGPIGDQAAQGDSNSQTLPKVAPRSPASGLPDRYSVDRLQRQNATLAYWQTAVASLHEIRFHMPTGDEPAGQFYDRMYLELGKLTSRAESAPTTGVDQDLLDLATRHLAVEHRLLLANVKTGQLLKEAGVPAGSDTISDRIAHREGLVTAALANPALLDKIPEGELKALFMELLDLEKQRLEQHREIEIMQAVLQERYSGTKFQLPNVN